MIFSTNSVMVKAWCIIDHRRIVSRQALSGCRGHCVGPCLIVCRLSRCSGRYHFAIARKACVIARFLGRTARCRFYDPTYPGFIHGQPSFHGKFLVTILSRLVLFLAFRVFRVAKKIQEFLDRSRRILEDCPRIRKKYSKICLCVFGDDSASNFYSLECSSGFPRSFGRRLSIPRL